MYGKSSQTVMIAWFVTAVVSAVATSRPERWALDIARVVQGEWWRLASGHLVHLSWQHLRYDLLALGLALYLCSRLEEDVTTIVFSVLFSAAVTSAALLVMRPVDIYGGLSGITAGLLACAAVRMIADDRWISGCVLLLAMLCKICLERQGLSASGVLPVWQAHCAGAVAGAIVSVSSLKQRFLVTSTRESRSTI